MACSVKRADQEEICAISSTGNQTVIVHAVARIAGGTVGAMWGVCQPVNYHDKAEAGTLKHSFAQIMDNAKHCIQNEARELTWLKFAGTEAGWTMSRIVAGAPLRKSSAEPLGLSSDHTTTPDLSVCDVNSMTFTIDSLASAADEVSSGCLGNTTVSRSCMTFFFFVSTTVDNSGIQDPKTELKSTAETKSDSVVSSD